jgi:hypothetical protein
VANGVGPGPEDQHWFDAASGDTPTFPGNGDLPLAQRKKIDLDHFDRSVVTYVSTISTRLVISAMTRPIPDKAEVALELPDKLYIGTFERSSRFDAHLDQNGVSLTLHRTGDADARKSVRMHFHYGLFADILNDLANTVAFMPPDDADHRDALRAAAKALYRALGTSGGSTGSKPGKFTNRPDVSA